MDAKCEYGVSSIPMLQYTHAIVRRPCLNMAAGLTSQTLGRPDHALAVIQHEAYVAALTGLGLKVDVLEADEAFADSVFVEDVALLTPACAVITRPGAESRRGEIGAMATVLKKRFTIVEHIDPPGTLDAGDIMMVGSHFYIGLSGRTNPDGAQQTIAILQRHGLTGSTVPLTTMLHLKSGVACLENNVLVVAGRCAIPRPLPSLTESR